MIKNWKSLFVKTDDDSVQSNNAPEPEKSNFSFPVGQSSDYIHQQTSNSISVNNPILSEVIQVYENGLESINMPGYDFFEFYKSVSAIGVINQPTYTMAFQMAKSLDNTISTQKLLNDAEFYISKINEVHSQYVAQGQAKLNALNDKKSEEKKSHTAAIDQASQRVTQLRAELQQLEADINNRRTLLSRIDENNLPQEQSIKEKLAANDLAQKTSINKLSAVKDNILRFIKD